MIPVRRPKFGNRKTVVDGIEFHSKREAKRWQELVLLERAGQIAGLRRQVIFEFPIAGTLLRYIHNFRQGKAVRYIADFVYEADGQNVVEDAKGYPTPDYKLKRALMLAVHGIRVTEI